MFDIQKIKSEAKRFAVYSVGRIAQSVLSFLLLPLYLKYFSVSEYGIITLTVLIISFIQMFASAGIMSALHRLYFSTDLDERKKIVGTALMWYIFSASLVCIVLQIFSNDVSQIIFNTTKYSYLIRLTGVIMIFSFLLDIPFNILRLEKKAAKYIGFSLFQFIINFIFKVLLIIILKRGVFGYFESEFISSLLCFILIIVFVIKYFTFSVNMKYLKELFKLGVPIVLGSFAVWSLRFFDRVILNYFYGQSSVGIYGAGYKFSQIFDILLFTPFSLLLPPIIFSYAENHSVVETKNLLEKLTYSFIFFGGILYLAICLFVGDFLKLLVLYFDANMDYLLAIPIIPIITMTQLIYFLAIPASYILLIIKKPKYLSFSSVIAAVLNFLLNLLLIPHFKELGAATATLISYIAFISVAHYFVQIKYIILYKWKSIFISLIFILSILILFKFISFNNIWINMIIKPILGTLLYILLYLYLSRILTKELKKKILFELKIFFKKLLKIKKRDISIFK